MRADRSAPHDLANLVDWLAGWLAVGVASLAVLALALQHVALALMGLFLVSVVVVIVARRLDGRPDAPVPHSDAGSRGLR